MTSFQLTLCGVCMFQYLLIFCYAIDLLNLKHQLKTVILYVNWLALVLFSLFNYIIHVYQLDSLFSGYPNLMLMLLLLLFLPYPIFRFLKNTD